jgi:hypothetical protein
MAYFDHELKTTLIFAVVGIAAGYLSFVINYTSVAALFAIVVFIAFYYLLKKAMKIQEEKKWWVTMAIVYFLTWVIVWTVFYNYALL